MTLYEKRFERPASIIATLNQCVRNNEQMQDIKTCKKEVKRETTCTWSRSYINVT